MTDRRSEPTLVTNAPSAGGGKGTMRSLGSGERLGRYTIIRLLGRGGMGAVYEAEDPELARRVAIKILHEDRDAAERDALRREAQALARLVHQNVVMVYDVGVDEAGDVFLVMQLVQGEDIDDWIARTRPTPEVIVAKFLQAGTGLAAAHKAGLVHCDFKPANVLIDGTGTVRVGDFGLAHRSRRTTGPSAGQTMPTLMTTLAGTPAYMAPEQFDGVVTPATDQFAFCVALWECLAGERPFDDSSTATLDPTARGKRRELPPGVKIPRFVRRVLDRGMQTAPTDRFPSMTALLETLARRRMTPVKIAAAVGVVALGGTAIYLVTRTEPATVAWGGADVANRQTLTAMGKVGCAYAPMVDPGGTVVFDRTEGDAVDLYSVPLTGGPSRRLTSGPGWEWRAQPGRRPGEVSFLILDRVDEARSQVAYLDLVTGKQTTVVPGVIWDAVTVGDRVFYSPQENKGVWAVKGEEAEAFVMPGSSYTFYGVTASRGGERLAVTRLETSGGDIGVPCTIEVATRLVQCLDLLVPSRPAFGVDPDTLYIPSVNGIVRRDLRTGQDTKIVDDYAEGGLTIAPDGSALIFSECRSHTKIIDAASDTLVLDDPDAQLMVPSSTGDVAWLRTVAGRRVVMMRTKDGRTTQLTQPAQGTAGFPRFSSDGKRLVFALSTPQAGLHMIALDKIGSLRQLTDSAKDHSPHWIGDSVAFTRTDDAANDHVFLATIDGGEVIQLSPSSRTLYGVKGKELLVGGVTGAYWLDPVTRKERPGPPRPPGDEPEVGVTSPAGDWVVFQLGAASNVIYRAQTDGSTAPELVRRFDSNIGVGRPSITDEGRVWITAGPMYGDLVKIPAKPGARF